MEKDKHDKRLKDEGIERVKPSDPQTLGDESGGTPPPPDPPPGGGGGGSGGGVGG